LYRVVGNRDVEPVIEGRRMILTSWLLRFLLPLRSTAMKVSPSALLSAPNIIGTPQLGGAHARVFAQPDSGKRVADQQSALPS